MMNLQAIARYPGARSFYDNASDRLLFYGREEEIDLLFHRVCATRLLLLFGKSGVGKTSLLQAGVFERLRQQQNMLPILVRFNLPASPLETIQTAVSETCQKCGVDYTPGEGETLWEFFKTMMLWQGDVLLTPVLVLDQFEEIFTLRSAQERAELACELGDLFRAALPPRVRQRRQLRDAADNSNTALTVSLSEQPPNVNVIISVREDFVGALQELAAEIPGIFDDRVRLNPLSDIQAKQAICQPAACKPTEIAQFTTPSFSYEDDALAEIIRYLRGKSGVIEPFQLQLVCQDIEQQVLQLSAQGQPVACITSELLGGEKRLNTVVKNFYQQTLAKLPQRDRRNAQRLCEEGLLNAEGFRLPLQENEIFKRYHLDGQALAPLVEARLLRKESRLESNFYELSHDSLARPILESRPWKLTYKQRLLAFAGLAMLVIVIVFGFLQWGQKERAGLAMLMLVTGLSFLQWGLRKQAYAAKKQAQEAREAAENVLNFLVFDLRDKLAPLGRLDIIEMIQQRVNDYYEKLGTEGQSTAVLNRRAVSHANEGDRLFDQGKLKEAGEAYQRFSLLIKQIALLEPHEQIWQKNVSASLEKIGDVLNAQGKPEEALKNYHESLAIGQRLVAQDPSNTGWQRDVSVSLTRIGDVLNAQGNPEEALKNYQESLAIGQRLVVQDPSNVDWQRDVSLSLTRIGDVLNAQGKPEEALKNYQESLAIGQRLVAQDPSNTGWQRDVSVSLEKIGDVLDEQGKLKDALKNYQESFAIRQKLAAHDPSNSGWQNDLIATYGSIAWYQLLNHQPEKAIEASQYGLAIKTNERMEATLHTNLAHGYLFTGEFDKAQAIYLRYRDKTVSDGRSFKQAVLDDFKEFRQRGIDHPDMSRIEALMR